MSWASQYWIRSKSVIVHSYWIAWNTIMSWNLHDVILWHPSNSTRLINVIASNIFGFKRNAGRFFIFFFFVSSSINFQASSIAIFDENWAAEDANERETWCRMLIFFTLTASKDVQFRLNNGIDDLNQQHRCVASINKTEKSFGAITMHRTPFDWQSNAFLVLVINFSGW